MLIAYFYLFTVVGKVRSAVPSLFRGDCDYRIGHIYKQRINAYPRSRTLKLRPLTNFTSRNPYLYAAKFENFPRPEKVRKWPCLAPFGCEYCSVSFE
jgi:hypothetical protein